jgi:hypothetical protein
MPICCDQDVIFDPQHNIFIWYRQAQNDKLYLGENFFALGISSDLKNWTFYAVKPTDIDSTWTKQWFDYPQIALGNKYLYITTNVQRTEILGIKESLHTLIIRISLDDLKRGLDAEFSFFQDSSGSKSFAPVQGARDIRSGVKVTNVLENIGIFGIESVNQQLLNKVIDDLRHDPRIASVQPTVCVGINAVGA